MSAWRSFLVAVSFLTVFPVPLRPPPRPEELDRARSFFPLVGWLVGVVLWTVMVATASLPEGLAAGIVLLFWLATTGMLHLDGFLDSADALLAPRPPERRLEILRDVHLGTFAFGAGFLLLLLKWQAIGASGPMALLLAPVAARSWLLLLLRAYPSGRPGGLAAAVRGRGGHGLLGMLFALPVLVLAPWALLVSGVAMLTLAGWAARRLGGALTGDVYGALIEVGELAFLLVATVSRM